MVETYFVALQAAGFLVDRLRESHPEHERFTDPSENERRKRIPLFLFLRGIKPAAPGCARIDYRP